MSQLFLFIVFWSEGAIYSLPFLFYVRLCAKPFSTQCQSGHPGEGSESWTWHSFSCISSLRQAQNLVPQWRRKEKWTVCAQIEKNGQSPFQDFEFKWMQKINTCFYTYRSNLPSWCMLMYQHRPQFHFSNIKVVAQILFFFLNGLILFFRDIPTAPSVGSVTLPSLCKSHRKSSSQKAPESGALAVFSQYHRFRDKVFIERKSTLGQSWQGEREENECCSFHDFDWMAPPPARMTP